LDFNRKDFTIFDILYIIKRSDEIIGLKNTNQVISREYIHYLDASSDR